MMKVNRSGTNRLPGILLIGVLLLLGACSSQRYRMRVEVEAGVSTSLTIAGDRPEVTLTNEGPAIIEAAFERPEVFAEEMAEGEKVTHRSDGGPIRIFLSTTSTKRTWVRIEARKATGLSMVRTPAKR